MIKVGGMMVDASAGGGLVIDSSFATSICAAHVLFFALSIRRVPPLHQHKT